MSVDMSPSAITARLRQASDLTDLRTAARLHGKVDMSPAGITRRIREVERLRKLCAQLGRLRAVEPGER